MVVLISDYRRDPVLIGGSVVGDAPFDIWLAVGERIRHTRRNGAEVCVDVGAAPERRGAPYLGSGNVRVVREERVDGLKVISGGLDRPTRGSPRRRA